MSTGLRVIPGRAGKDNGADGKTRGLLFWFLRQGLMESVLF